MRSLLRLAALVALSVSPMLAQQSSNESPGATPCSVRFTVVHYEGRLLAYGQMSEAQQKWWAKNGEKKFKQACLDATAPEYLIVWGSEMENHAGVWFRYKPGTTSQTNIDGTATDQQGNRTNMSATATTTTQGSLETVPTVRTVHRVHVYVFTWRDGKLGGPIWMEDQAGEGWRERGVFRSDASSALLDKALIVATSAAEKLVSDRMGIVNALMVKIHELAVANKLPESDEPACDQKISQQIGTSKEMLDRLEHRDFADVEDLFQKLCKSAGSN